MLIQVLVVSIVAIIATVGVYGIVALIIRMDDLGYNLIKRSKGGKGFLAGIGNVLVKALPIVIKSLSIIGTIALILVAGGIFTHNIDFFHHFMEAIPSFIKDAIVGLLVGLAAVLVMKFFSMLFKKKVVM